MTTLTASIEKMKEAEIWKPVFYKGNSHHYEVSNHGNVRNSKTLKVLKPSLDTNGYPQISMVHNGKNISARVHRLVGLHFLEGEPKYAINHIDGNKRNPHAKNLEWVSLAENAKHASETGLLKVFSGQNNHCSKLRDEYIPQIMEKSKTMSIGALCREYSVGFNAMKDVLTGKSYRHIPRALKAAGCLYCKEGK